MTSELNPEIIKKLEEVQSYNEIIENRIRKFLLRIFYNASYRIYLTPKIKQAFKILFPNSILNWLFNINIKPNENLYLKHLNNNIKDFEDNIEMSKQYSDLVLSLSVNKDENGESTNLIYRLEKNYENDIILNKEFKTIAQELSKLLISYENEKGVRALREELNKYTIEHKKLIESNFLTKFDDRFVDNMKVRKNFLTSIEEVNKMDRQGFRSGELILIAATSGGRKSSLFIYELLEMAKKGYKVSLYMLDELTEETVLMRILACLFKISYKELAGNKERIKELINNDVWLEIKDNINIITFTDSELKPELSVIKSMISTDQSEVIFIDYDQYITLENLKDDDAVYTHDKRVYTTLKDLASQKDKCIIIAAQAVADVKGKVGIDNIRGGKIKYQLASCVFTMQKVEKYGETLENDCSKDGILKCLKMRDGYLFQNAVYARNFSFEFKPEVKSVDKNDSTSTQNKAVY